MRSVTFFLGLCLVSGIALAAPAKTADTLDQKRIQTEYGDGNFETVIQILEDFRAKHAQTRALDSFYVAKYLGVVYASNPNSREKGKYWLYRMLQLDPTADLVDLYVGEEVDRTFEKVRQEFIVRRNYRGINDVRLAKAVKEGEPPHKDTVVLRDTVVMGNQGDTSLPPPKALKEFRKGWTFNVNLGMGMKFLDKVDWGELEIQRQTEFRLATDARQPRWPINVAFDYMHSYSQEKFYIDTTTGRTVAYKGTTDELNLGVRKIFDRKLYSMRPFVGGGLGYISTSFFKDLEKSFQNGSLGMWADGGIYWELERHFNIGVEGIWSWAEIPIVVVDVNAGGLHVEMLVGYHW